MLKYLNQDRKRHQLKPVRMQEDLRVVARKHSLDMAQKDYFAHVNMSAQSHVDRLKLKGVTDVVSGENLAKIGGYRNPTQVAEEGLMNSPGHRANILNGSYNVVGIGVIQSGQKVYYFTQNFAHRDIVFKGKFPGYIRRNHFLKISGQVFTDAKLVLVVAMLKNDKKPLIQEVARVNNHKFFLDLKFATIGRFDIYVYVDNLGNGKFSLSNQFELEVKRGFFF